MTIRHKPGDNDRMKAVIDQLRQKVIKVGYFEHSKYPDGTPIAYVATIQELGYEAGGIPPRPTMRPTMTDNKQKHRDGVAAAFRRAMKGTQTVDQGLEQLGEVIAGDVRENIALLADPELKDSTVEARARRHHAGLASNKPLVDTGQMLQAVSHSVEKK